MTKAQKTRVRLVALTFGLVGLLVPVTLSSGEGVEANDACAGGSCCREAGSVCDQDGEILMNYYPSASCKPTVQ